MPNMRLEYVDIERATPEQRAVIDTVASSPRGPIRGGPIGIWLHSPEFAQRAQHLGTFCRFQSTVPPLLSELTILICAAHWHAGYEWSSHLGPALKAGLSQDAADALR
ncbi:MAG TPA: hypothetical protein VK523_11980 [Steroidobacteraceae bacterium]|nr:hypothetical protein [Steroidobacteraceae bacterium]